jgi:hypothetical protein
MIGWLYGIAARVLQDRLGRLFDADYTEAERRFLAALDAA